MLENIINIHIKSQTSKQNAKLNISALINNINFNKIKIINRFQCTKSKK
jgi:hypothetical protein